MSRLQLNTWLRRRRGAIAITTLLATAIAGLVVATGVKRAAPPNYEVYAVRYASLPFRVSGLIAGADTSRRLDIAMMVWLLKGPNGRNVLVDAGFYREPFMARWKPVDFAKPSDAVAKAGVKPEDITDII